MKTLPHDPRHSRPPLLIIAQLVMGQLILSDPHSPKLDQGPPALGLPDGRGRRSFTSAPLAAGDRLDAPQREALRSPVVILDLDDRLDFALAVKRPTRNRARVWWPRKARVRGRAEAPVDDQRLVASPGDPGREGGLGGADFALLGDGQGPPPDRPPVPERVPGDQQGEPAPAPLLGLAQVERPGLPGQSPTSVGSGGWAGRAAAPAPSPGRARVSDTPRLSGSGAAATPSASRHPHAPASAGALHLVGQEGEPAAPEQQRRPEDAAGADPERPFGQVGRWFETRRRPGADLPTSPPPPTPTTAPATPFLGRERLEARPARGGMVDCQEVPLAGPVGPEHHQGLVGPGRRGRRWGRSPAARVREGNQRSTTAASPGSGNCSAQYRKRARGRTSPTGPPKAGAVGPGEADAWRKNLSIHASKRSGQPAPRPRRASASAARHAGQSATGAAGASPRNRPTGEPAIERPRLAVHDPGRDGTGQDGDLLIRRASRLAHDTSLSPRTFRPHITPHRLQHVGSSPAEEERRLANAQGLGSDAQPLFKDRGARLSPRRSYSRKISTHGRFSKPLHPKIMDIGCGERCPRGSGVRRLPDLSGTPFA